MSKTAGGQAKRAPRDDSAGDADDAGVTEPQPATEAGGAASPVLTR